MTHEKHVFCAWCWRAVPAHGDTYVPKPHPDTTGKPCRGDTMRGATTYSVGTPPCERGDDGACVPVIALPSSADCAVALAERSAEAEALRAEAARLRKELDAARRLLADAARGKLRRCETCGERLATRRWRGTSVDVCDRCFDEDKRDAADAWEALDEEACEDLPHAAALRAAMEAAK